MRTIPNLNTKINNMICFSSKAIIGDVSTANKISFPYFKAFTSLLRDVKLVERIYSNAAAGLGKQ